MGGIADLLGGYAQQKQLQHKTDYDNEMSERQLRLNVLLKAADNPDLTLEERRHVLNEAGSLMGTPVVKGLFGREKKKASGGMALGDLLIPQSELDKRESLTTAPKENATFESPASQSVVPGMPDTQASTVTLEPPPPLLSSTPNGQRRVGDITAERQLRIDKARMGSEFEMRSRMNQDDIKARGEEARKTEEVRQRGQLAVAEARGRAMRELKGNERLDALTNIEMAANPGMDVDTARRVAAQRAIEYDTSKTTVNTSKTTLNNTMAGEAPKRTQIMERNAETGRIRVQIMDEANRLKEYELKGVDIQIAKARAKRRAAQAWSPDYTNTMTQIYARDEIQAMRDKGEITDDMYRNAQLDPNGKDAQTLAAAQREARRRADARVAKEKEGMASQYEDEEIEKIAQGQSGGRRAPKANGKAAATSKPVITEQSIRDKAKSKGITDETVIQANIEAAKRAAAAGQIIFK